MQNKAEKINVHFYQDSILREEEVLRHFGDDILKLYREAIYSLISGRNNSGLRFKKLKGSDDILAIRLNKEHRLLFTLVNDDGISYILLLEIVTNHKYAKAKYLKRNAFKSFISKNEEEIKAEIYKLKPANILQPVLTPNTFQIDFSPKTFYKGKLITYDAAQLKAFEIEGPKGMEPAILTGAPGAGKSCVAIGLIKKSYLSNPQRKILYLANFKTLVDEMQEIWQESFLEDYNADANEVEFKTYAEVVSENCLALNAQVGKNHFVPWMTGYIQDYKKRNQKEASILGNAFFVDIEKIYKEFRILAAYKEADYYNLGERQSLFAKKNNRAKAKKEMTWVFEVFVKYQRHLHENKLIDLALTDVLGSEPLYDVIVVDEAQDLSHLQLAVLCRLAKNRAIYFCGDSNQALFDNCSKFSYIESLLSGQKFKRINLSSTFRCPSAILPFANEVLLIKQFILGGLRAEELANITEKSSKKGWVSWVFPTDSLDQLKKEAAESRQVAVITLENYKEEARKVFPKAMVFTAEEAKGREFRKVILFQFLSTSVCEDISRLLPKSNIKLKLHQNKTKSYDTNPQFEPYISKLFTAITRVTESLVFYQAKNHKINNFYERMNQLLPTDHKKQLNHVNYTVTTVEEWKAEASLQSRLGNVEQAELIIKNHVKPAEEKKSAPKIPASRAPTMRKNAAAITVKAIPAKEQPKPVVKITLEQIDRLAKMESAMKQPASHAKNQMLEEITTLDGQSHFIQELDNQIFEGGNASTSFKHLLKPEKKIYFRTGEKAECDSFPTFFLRHNFYPAFTTLNLVASPLYRPAMEKLLSALTSNQSITALKLNAASIKDSDMKYFCHSLKRNNTLLSLAIKRPKRFVNPKQESLQRTSENSVNPCKDLHLSFASLLYLFKSLAVNQTLQSLSFSPILLHGVYTDSMLAKALGDSLTKNTALTHLEIKHSLKDFFEEGFLTNALKNRMTPLKLSLGHLRIQEKNQPFLIETYLNGNTDQCKLKHANLEDSDLSAFFEALPANQTLTMLNLKGNNLEEEGISLLCEALTKQNRVHTLNLSKNYLSDQHLSDLSRLINENQQLTSLDLSHNDFGEEGYDYFYQAIKNSSQLKKIDLSWNPLSNQSFRSLVKNEVINTSLQSLNLSYSLPYGVGQGDIFLAFPGLTSLKLKHEGKNLLFDSGIFETLSDNNRLKKLSVSGFECDTDIIENLYWFLETNTHLKKLNLSSSKISTKNAAILFKSLLDNNTLEYLGLKGNKIEMITVELIHLIKNNTALKIINFKDNPVCYFGRSNSNALGQALQTNYSLRHFKGINFPIVRYILERNRAIESCLATIDHCLDNGKLESCLELEGLISRLIFQTPSEIKSFVKHFVEVVSKKSSGELTEFWKAKKSAALIWKNQELSALSDKLIRYIEAYIATKSSALPVSDQMPEGGNALTSLSEAPENPHPVAAYAYPLIHLDLSKMNLMREELNTKDMDGSQLLTCNIQNKNLTAEAIYQLLQWLMPNKSLEQLRIQSQDIYDEDLALVNQLLVRMRQLKSLKLKDTVEILPDRTADNFINLMKINKNIQRLSIVNAESIVKSGFFNAFLQNNRTVKTLDLPRNQITDEDFLKMFIGAIIPGKRPQLHLTALNLKANALTGNSVANIAALISDSSTLSFLNLSYNPLEHEGLKAFATLVSYSETLLHLNLSGILSHPVDIKVFTDALKANKRLQSLYLADNFLDESALVLLFDYLEKTESLTLLDISHNSLKAKAVDHLAKALKMNQSLNYLYLESVDLDDKSFPRVAEVMKCNKKLVKLNLVNNPFELESLIALSQMLKVNQSLRAINLSYCYVGNQGLIHLAKALRANKTLTGLKMNGSSINDGAAIKNLVDALIDNSVLQSLSMKNNDLRCEAIKHIARLLSKNTSLTCLKLDKDMPVSFDSSDVLAQALAQNTTLRELRFKNAYVNRTFTQMLKQNRTLFHYKGEKSPAFNRLFEKNRSRQLTPWKAKIENLTTGTEPGMTTG